MTKEELLSQLKDIHLPFPISWWPLAPGWYILLGLTLIIVLLVILFAYRARKKKNFIKHLQAELTNIYQAHKDNAHEYAQRLSPLLKRIALIRFSHRKVKHLHSQAWEAFLNTHSKSETFAQLTAASYGPNVELDTKTLHQQSLKLVPILLKAKTK